MRPAAAGSSLIEEDDAIGVRIEEATVVGNESGPWSTVQKDDWLSVRRAALFVIELVHIGHSDVSAIVGFDLVVESSARFHIAGDYRVSRRQTQREVASDAN